jgi:hypothetical protein
MRRGSASAVSLLNLNTAPVIEERPLHFRNTKGSHQKLETRNYAAHCVVLSCKRKRSPLAVGGQDASKSKNQKPYVLCPNHMSIAIAQFS